MTATQQEYEHVVQSQGESADAQIRAAAGKAETAQATITWTNASGAIKRSTLRLILQPAPRGDPEWRISHLETDTS